MSALQVQILFQAGSLPLSSIAWKIQLGQNIVRMTISLSFGHVIGHRLCFWIVAAVDISCKFRAMLFALGDNLLGRRLDGADQI